MSNERHHTIFSTQILTRMARFKPHATDMSKPSSTMTYGEINDQPRRGKNWVDFFPFSLLFHLISKITQTIKSHGPVCVDRSNERIQPYPLYSYGE